MPAVSIRPELSQNYWTTERIIDLVQQRFNKRPCWYQIEAAKAFYLGNDMIGCAPTGAGKTLSFWIPLLMAQHDHKKKILFVVSPLNVLAKQNVRTLLEAGISAIAVAAENATSSTFKDIERGKYEVVVTNPEILVTNEELQVLWKWGKFRKHYLAVGILRYLISEPVPFYAASATFPPPIITETCRLLHMNSKSTTEILCSNDRPKISLMVRELVYPSSSYQDLAFLIPYNWQNTMKKPKKFLVFFDNIKEAEVATRYFQRRLLREFHSRIAWFHSTMSQEYRDAKLKEFREGKVWGMFCTDAFGLGMDVGDVEVVVQYKATCDFSTLWQRFGHAARASGAQGVGILLVERKDTHGGRQLKSTSSSKRRRNDLQTGRGKRQRCSMQEEQTVMMDVDRTCQPTVASCYSDPGPVLSWGDTSIRSYQSS